MVRRALPVTGAVLAGGQGQRMGGVDKGWQILAGVPLVERSLVRLRPQVAEVMISANRNRERYAALGCPVVEDAIAGFAGPLAGLHAALGRASMPLVVTVPCDSPFFPEDLVDRLYQALLAQQADLAVASVENKRQPVFCLCRTALRHSLEDFLRGGERRFGLWLESVSAVTVEFPDPAAFANINTLAELAAHGMTGQ